jgi:hypothetical protein
MRARSALCALCALVAAAAPLAGTSAAGVMARLRSRSGAVLTLRKVFSSGHGDLSTNLTHDAFNTLQIVDLDVDGQALRVVVDTGSTNTWVASDACHNDCRGVPLFAVAKAKHTTKADPPMGISVTYGSGSFGGDAYLTTVSVGGTGGLTVAGQLVFLANEGQGVFSEIAGEYSGILGLGFRALAFQQHLPVFDHLCQAGLVTNNQFYFLLANPSAEFFVMGEPADFAQHFVGDLRSVPVIDPYYWSIELDDLLYNGQSVLTHEVRAKDCRSSFRGRTGLCKLVLDTGMTFGTFPRAATDKLRQAHRKDCAGSGRGRITYVIGGHHYDFEYGELLGAAPGCSPMSVALLDVTNEHGPLFGAGRTFLKRYLAIHRRGPDGKDQDSQVLLATANKEYTGSLGSAVRDAMAAAT